MRGKPVDCVVKSPVALQLGDVVSDSVRPGVYITDVVLSAPVNIDEISFKNYYTAYLTVRVLKNEADSDESPATWFTCVRNLHLMSSPHTEGGSQDYFSIYRQQMLTEPDNVITVRLILRQPSSVWLNFNIEHIQVYSLAGEVVNNLAIRNAPRECKPPPRNPSHSLRAIVATDTHTTDLRTFSLVEESERDVPSWLSTITSAEEPFDLNGLPDPDAVSSSIQHMWALTEIMQSSQTSTSIGRFDVDGCYDVNLLSYT